MDVTTSIQGVIEQQEPNWSLVEIDDPQKLSTNFYWQLKIEGLDVPFSMQTTLRGIPSPEQIAGHLDATQHAVLLVTTQGGVAKKQAENIVLSDNGKKPAAQPAQGKAEDIPQPGTTPNAVTKKTDTTSITFPDLAVERGATQAFHTKNIVVTETNGNKYFRMRSESGQYAKYGMKVWPEVLVEAGIDPAVLNIKKDNIDPNTKGTPYNCHGTAYFTINPDDGKPVKIVLFERDPQ